jgi:hypothetical protein
MISRSAQAAPFFRKKVLLKDLWNAVHEERVGAYRSASNPFRARSGGEAHFEK